MRYFLVISLNLMVLGAINKSYTQAYYNVIKDPSFEEDSRFWEVDFTLNGAGANSHFPDSTTPHGYYVGITAAAVLPSFGVGELEQKLVPRAIKDFDNENSLEFWIRRKPFKKGSYDEWGIYIYGGGSGSSPLSFINVGEEKENKWNEVKIGNLYKLAKQRGWKETDSIRGIMLYSAGSGEQGQEVRWDYIQLLSSRFDIDGAIISIDSPLETKVGHGYIPKATLKNVGALDIRGVTAACQIVFDRCGAVYNDTVVSYCALRSDDTMQISFKEWIPENPSSDYYITIDFLVEDDQNLDNNRLFRNLKVTGIEEKINETELTEIKLKPSIFSRQATVYLPKGEKARIYDPSGKLVKELYDSDRDGRVSFGSTLKPGVYFYRIRDKVGKIVKIE